MTDTIEATAPTQYKRNAQGYLVPIEKIKPLDMLRDELVDDIVRDARHTQAVLREFKTRTMAKINAFIELSAAEYNTQVGGLKGNFMLTSYDGRFRVQYKKQDTLSFNERLLVAKSLIDQLIHQWAEGSRIEIKTLIEHAFQTDKQGNINRGRVLGLLTLNIDDPQWQAAMEAIKDSIEVSSSKGYLLIHERVGDDDRYEMISLDMARL